MMFKEPGMKAVSMMYQLRYHWTNSDIFLIVSQPVVMYLVTPVFNMWWKAKLYLFAINELHSETFC